MIELQVPTPRTPQDREVEATLNELVVSWQLNEHPGDESAPLPAIVESGKRYGPDELDEYLLDLRHTLEQWRKFQADACYIDDDGSVC